MPKATLTTKGAVDTIPHPEKGQLVYWDSELTGFGVLAGARQKTFVLERRINGKPRRVTLGRVGQITLQKAKADAEQLIGEMRGGSASRRVGTNQGGNEEKEPVENDVRRLSIQDRLPPERLA